MSDDIKQVIIVRTKYPDGNGGTRGLRAGKLIAQACHASMGFLRCKNKCLTEIQSKWLLSESHKKIVCQVNDEESLIKLESEAKQLGLTTYLVTDAGLTEFAGIPTVTVLSIGPNDSLEIDKITKNLKLY